MFGIKEDCARVKPKATRVDYLIERVVRGARDVTWTFAGVFVVLEGRSQVPGD
jgi:hypothetical protein